MVLQPYIASGDTHTTLSSRHSHTEFSLLSAIFVNSIGLLAYAIILPSMAILSDKFGRARIIILACVAIVFLSYPIFLLIAVSKNIVTILIMQILLSALMAGCVGPMSAFWTELFPTKNRASGFSLGYNLGITLFGGFAPLLATWMIKLSGNQQAACFLIILLALSTLIAMKITKYNNPIIFIGD